MKNGQKLKCIKNVTYLERTQFFAGRYYEIYYVSELIVSISCDNNAKFTFRPYDIPFYFQPLFKYGK